VLSDLENMGTAVGILLLLRTQPKIQVLYMYFRFMAIILIFDMDFCHLLFLLSAATLMMSFPFRNLYKIVSTDICCRGRHRVTAGNQQSVRIEYPEE